jgi:hypothetical protein
MLDWAGLLWLTVTATEAALAQLNALLNEYNTFKRHTGTNQQDADAAKMVYRLQAAIERLTPPSSSYRQDLDRSRGVRYYKSTGRMVGVAAIAAALRDDIAAGWLSSVIGLAHADTYADYLTMADGLAVQHYKDAAAVIAGTSLEVHLKALATKEGIDLQATSGAPKKVGIVNDELKREGVYSALEHKQVIAWLAIRNSAAHGTYGDYDEAAVKALIEGVGNFAVKYPA